MFSFRLVDSPNNDSTASSQRDETLLTHQLARTPRKPWRVAARCSHGAPTVIVSPSQLEDGSRFPNWAYLTCPHLVREISKIESENGAAHYAALLEVSEDSQEARRKLDSQLRSARLKECIDYGQTDICAEVGIAGQQNIYAIKCLHIHTAYHLAGLQDDIGADLIARISPCKEGSLCELL